MTRGGLETKACVSSHRHRQPGLMYRFSRAYTFRRIIYTHIYTYQAMAADGGGGGFASGAGPGGRDQ